MYICRCRWAGTCTCSTLHIPYSGVFWWVQIFVKCWRWLSELIFVVLKFVANDARISSQTHAHTRNNNYEL